MSAATSAPAVPRTAPAFRTDIHGLRGLAVMLVVLYHVFVGRVSGGVDVFLLISAYFLTGTFLRRLETGRPIAPVQYWGRTFKRLLPPTVVVTLATVAAGLLLLPATERDALLADALHTLLQVENWWLISQATDYYAADRTVASPFQHFWSLSIQGQVFLAWPLMFALVALAVRRTGPAVRPLRARQAAAGAIAALTAVSFTWSVLETAANQQVAYFDTLARLWEFGLGALMAILLPPLAARYRAVDPASTAARGVRIAVSMAGVAALVSMGALVDVAGLFPGWLALWPLTAAILVMVAGVNPLLSSRPLQFLGGISYALYLVHWPLLIIMLHVLDRPAAGPLLGIVLVAASVGLAHLLTIAVDTPFRRWEWAGRRTHRSVGVAASALAVGLVAVLGLQSVLAAQQAERERLAYANNPGARVLAADYTPHPQADPDAPELPGAAALSSEWFGLPETCTGRFDTGDDALQEVCRIRSGEDGEQAPTIVLWGNSRVEQMSAAIDPLAQRHGWTSLALFEGGCAPALQDNAECAAFTRASLEYILALRPEAVALHTTFVPSGGGIERTTAEVEQVVERLREAGITVIALRDQPRLELNLVQCREEGRADCTSAPSRTMPATRPDTWVLDAARDDPGIIPVDLTAQICPEDRCVPAIGNVTVFLDGAHITKTYGASLQDEVARQTRPLWEQ